MRKWLGLIAWLALVFTASLTSVFVSTDGWYAELSKPAWNPPNWIFGPVWTVLNTFATHLGEPPVPATSTLLLVENH